MVIVLLLIILVSNKNHLYQVNTINNSHILELTFNSEFVKDPNSIKQ